MRLRAVPAGAFLVVALGVVSGCAGVGKAAPTTIAPEHQHHPGASSPAAAVVADEDAAAAQAGAELAVRLAVAKPGDTVVVAAGRYLGNFVVKVGVSLVGEGRPILDGGGTGTVLTIDSAATGASVRGLRLRASGTGPVGTPTGLRVLADDVTAQDIEITDVYMGIQVMGADGAHLFGNTIASFPDGIVSNELHATGGEVDLTGTSHSGHGSSVTKLRGDAITLGNTSNAVVTGNTIIDVRDGIFLSFASDTALGGNRVSDSRYAVHGMYAERLLVKDNYFEGNLAGAILMYGGPFEVRGNTILRSSSPATGFGLVLKDGSGATIADNVIVFNRVGIKLDNGGATSSTSAPAVMRSNTIAMNQVGVQIMEASRGSFARNSFAENTVQVVTDGEVPNIEWSVAETGNFWSNYRGYDSDGDGVGDVDFVDGGTISSTLTRSPVMISLASGPGLRLLQAIQDRWASNEPVVRDRHPLVEMDSPVVVRELQPGRVSAWFGVAGGAMATSACGALLWGRRGRMGRHV
ncbi:MAG: right-handed parallel beta-helix repeat-containing protein [Actinobacteria bacterium]|nr:right-handed parallel beta-helix repeat-containing protein [Actinomycetota bacterium]